MPSPDVCTATVAKSGLAAASDNFDGELWKSGAAQQNGKSKPSREPEGTDRLQVLHEVFETEADRRPDAVAVEFAQEHVTYSPLQSRAPPTPPALPPPA